MWIKQPPLASEIAARLQELITKHGDLPFLLWDADTGYLMVPSVEFYAEDRYRPARIEIGGDYDSTTEWKSTPR